MVRFFLSQASWHATAASSVTQCLQPRACTWDSNSRLAGCRCHCYPMPAILSAGTLSVQGMLLQQARWQVAEAHLPLQVSAQNCELWQLWGMWMCQHGWESSISCLGSLTANQVPGCRGRCTAERTASAGGPASLIWQPSPVATSQHQAHCTACTAVCCCRRIQGVPPCQLDSTI